MPETTNHFCCIPGSHRANFPIPETYRSLANNALLRHVILKAGDAVIFSEALVHGTFKVQNSGPRRSVFARYMNNHSYFRRPASQREIDSLPPTPNHSETSHAQVFSTRGFTARQRQLVVEPAYARGHAPVGS
ncbi:phytanoyl-CoA dioxygenase family protein [Pandoraea faecigallinarum]|uniref:phytanoyl-CoA dioxygenase family protein n=1 Tax=Pandoraea faecigallinarum TaxID=656179 RepID=UPI001F4569B1|nr:phytanoyl-CoA dioxygenase family protein [Pandoraea faecigallinarum]